MRAVDVDQLRVRLQQPLERIEVVRPAILVATLPHAHAGAGAARELQGGAVAGRLDHRVVARIQKPVTGDEDALLGSRQREHVGRLDVLVASRDRRAQLRGARYLGVAQAQLQ